VLSGAAAPQYAERAMDAVRTHLVRRGAQVVLVLTPPFDQSSQDPGYIKGYPPGVRENGGQYTHAAVWTIMAVARLGNGDEAVELFHLLNPINHTRSAADVERYKVEPYVTAGDVYAHPAHAGRGGWTWYTGSAGWMYRVGREHPRSPPPRGDLPDGSLHPLFLARVPRNLALRSDALRHRGHEPEPSVPRDRRGDAGGSVRRPARHPPGRRRQYPSRAARARRSETARGRRISAAATSPDRPFLVAMPDDAEG
jgi:hypothetical protein